MFLEPREARSLFQDSLVVCLALHEPDTVLHISLYRLKVYVHERSVLSLFLSRSFFFHVYYFSLVFL